MWPRLWHHIILHLSQLSKEWVPGRRNRKKKVLDKIKCNERSEGNGRGENDGEGFMEKVILVGLTDSWRGVVKWRGGRRTCGEGKVPSIK